MRSLRLAGVAVCLAMLSAMGGATTYYVDATGGDDSRAGLSAATAWKTVAKVNGATFQPGDQVLFKRGETWRESLVPLSSGAAGNPILFDAYGSGEAPTLTGYLDLPAASWSLDSGNVWKATVTGTSMSYVLFGSGWGQKQTSGKSACVSPRDFYFYSNTLYVYSHGNPAAVYGSVAAMLLAYGQMIYVNGKSWLTFQHFRMMYFDTYGFRIGGASDHITVANSSAEGIIPTGAQPHGFYVNASPNPTEIKFLNDEAHRNYDGFRFSGGATGITVSNCKAYANRDKGLQDDTGGATYSDCHFYANGIGVFESTDVQGGVAGLGNIPADTWPAVIGFMQYPARITTTVDDVGLAAGTDTYINSLLPQYDARGLKMSMAVTTGYASGVVSAIQSWLSSGHDIDSHSWSHQYYTNTNAFSMQYTGSGTAATLTISGNRLTTNVVGGPGGQNLDLTLTNAAYDSVSELVATINSHAGYTATLDASCQGAAHSLALADVSSQSILTNYVAQWQKDRLIPDEMATSKAWLQTNLTGLPSVKAYVYPAGIEDTSTQGWAVNAGYEGARGAMTMDLGWKQVYAAGVNIQNITSMGMSILHNASAQQIAQKVQALTFKSAVWGVPYGLFWHLNELTPTEVGELLDGLQATGAAVMTNSQLLDWIVSQGRVGTTTLYESAQTGSANFLPTAGSPIVDQGADLGSSFVLDEEGMNQSWLGNGWEIGAHALVPSGAMMVVVE